jgi:GTP cyclohydrolase IV
VNDRHRLVEGPPQPRLREVLPQHTRAARDFLATFGRSAEDTLASMNEAGDDVPNQSPRHQLAVARVGMTRTSIPLVVANPFGAPGTVHVACTVDTHVGLAPDRRGIHVSRLGHVLAELAGQPHASLHAYAIALCERVAEAQQCGNAEVAVSGVLSYVEHPGGVSQRASIEHLTLSAEARHRDGRTDAGHGLAFNHMTACPCVQQTFTHAVADGYGGEIADVDARQPQPTHSQRCHTRIAIGPCASPVPLDRLLAVVDRVVVRSQNTLPRDLELLAVHRAHREPQFVEDVLRDLLAAVHRLIGAEHPDATIRIRTTSLESIHDFDLDGEIVASVRELDRAGR